MKTCQLLMFLASCPTITGCGQIGPLYLPGTAPPVHVEREQKPETETETVATPEVKK
jgi:predicted small lipoprotein YifL